jgi:hypothetical protein
MAGGKHGARRRLTTFVAQNSAKAPGKATVVAQLRREHGSDLLLRDFRHCRHCKYKTLNHRDTENTERKDKERA